MQVRHVGVHLQSTSVCGALAQASATGDFSVVQQEMQTATVVAKVDGNKPVPADDLPAPRRWPEFAFESWGRTVPARWRFAPGEKGRFHPLAPRSGLD